MSPRLIAAAVLLIALACSKKPQVRKELMAMGPVILPNEMCADRGKVAYSNDAEGDRMLCELQPQLGTHIPRCVCIDEGFSDRERELAFEQLRGLGMINPCGSAPSCGAPNVLGGK